MANIERRGENTFRVTISAGFDGDGIRVRKKKTFNLDPNMTEKQKDKEIDRMAALFDAQVTGGAVIDSSIKFSEYVKVWLEKYALTSLQPNTFVSYKKEIDNRIIPALGNKRLDKIRPLDLVSFYGSLTADGIRLDGRPGHLSDRTIKMQHQILSSMFSTALRWQLINFSPCANVRPPKQKTAIIKPVVKFFDEKEAEIFIGIMEKEKMKYRAAVYLALFGGMRRGEILALTWDDIDFDNMTVDINKSRQCIHGQETILKGTKTDGSNRKISLPDAVINVLSQLKAEQDTKAEKMENLWHNSGMVLTTFDGQPMNDTAPYQAMKKAIKAYNNGIDQNGDLTEKQKSEYVLPNITFHALRHTSATLMIAAGVNVRAVSNRLGHSVTSTTMNIYAHALKSSDQQASDLLGNMIKLPASKLKLVK